MRSGLSQAQEQALMRPRAEIMPPPAVAPTTKEIPYDYVAKFKLEGKSGGNRVQDVINISTEGAFVAVAIGYSFIPSPLPRLPDIEIPQGEGESVFVNLLNIIANRIAVALARDNTYGPPIGELEGALVPIIGCVPPDLHRWGRF